jgi:hypothetical protein
MPGPIFLFPVKALSRVFRGKFLDLLKHCEGGKIEPTGKEIRALWKELERQCENPFGFPHTVLDYLGRYAHRVALSNDRILAIDQDQVTLTTKIAKTAIEKRP